MKFTRKRKLLIMAGMVILAMIASAWWIPVNSKPTLKFVGFREVNGERRALFSVQNHSAKQMDYSSVLVIPRDGPSGAAPEPNLALEGCRFDFIKIPFRGTLQAGESAFLSIPMKYGMVKDKAFQVVLPIRSTSPKWLETIGEWLNRSLPNNLWKPQDLDIWSEVVTP